MSARVSVSSELLEQLFGLPEGVHIARMDRIPIAGEPGGRWMWRMALVGDSLLIDGEATIVSQDRDPCPDCGSYRVISTEIRAAVSAVDVQAMPIGEYRRRRGDAGGEAVSTS